MIFLDPPEHTGAAAPRLEGLHAPACGRARGRASGTLCAGLLDAQHRDRDGFDYVQDFGARLPATVIAMLLGVPASDREDVRHHIDGLFHIEPGVGMANELSFESAGWLFTYLGQQVEERVQKPRDDMLTTWCKRRSWATMARPRRLTPGECTEFGILLVSAGTETVARLLGWAGLVLADHPEQLHSLAQDASLIPNAVEELLRFESPSPVQGRWLSEEVELHGQLIPANSKVLLLTGSAGRDERAYPEADTFDIRRDFRLHVAFGFGIHFCLGAALARMEGKIALEETLKRYKSWTVDKEHAVPLHTSTVAAITSCRSASERGLLTPCGFWASTPWGSTSIDAVGPPRDQGRGTRTVADSRCSPAHEDAGASKMPWHPRTSFRCLGAPDY